MLSMSSTTIIIKAFTDLNLRHRKFASLVFAVLIVEDLFAVLMMVVLSSIAINSSVEGGEMLYSVSKLAFFLIIWFVVGVFALPSLLNSQRRFLNSETLLIISMGLCLGMAVFSVACGFSLALGAFVMGSILAGTSFAERIERVTIPVKDLFGSIFFISVGMMVDPAIIAHYWLPILILSAVVICGMIFFGTTGMLLTGQSLRVAIESGFSLTQIGEFAFIIASLGMSLGVLDAQIYPIVVAVSVVTTFTTPYFIRMADPTANFVEAHLPRRLHFLINRYTEEATTSASATRQLWHSLFKRYLWRVVLYSIVLIAMSLISLDYIVPTFTGLFPNWGAPVCYRGFTASHGSLLAGHDLSGIKEDRARRLIAANARYDVPLIVMTIVRLLIAMTILVYLLSSIYSMKVGWTIGVGLFFILVLSFSKSAHKRMVRIESRFIDNLNERELRRSGAKNRLVPNMHLAYMTVGYKCPFVGEQLKNSGLRSRFGVSVASIQRGGDLIMVPGAEERVFPGDVLGVIGTDDEIQKLLPVVEAADDEAPEVSADDIRLTGVRLKASSPLIGKTIVSSNFRNVWESLLVSVQRDGDYLQPDPSIVFRRVTRSGL